MRANSLLISAIKVQPLCICKSNHLEPVKNSRKMKLYCKNDFVNNFIKEKLYNNHNIFYKFFNNFYDEIV